MNLAVSPLRAVAPPTPLPSIRDWAQSVRYPPKKRLVVESVSAELVTSTSGSLYTMQINGPFTLFMIPTLISDGVFNLKRYYATHAIRFYIEPGGIIQFQVATTGDAGQAVCYVSGYFLDI
jgi:hypothetical protein